eukprot:m.509190 g.509190  ORF g.509190 m.509190 type:complete len:523 (-) comp91699_c0_seq1:15-1583(-)
MGINMRVVRRVMLLGLVMAVCCGLLLSHIVTLSRAFRHAPRMSLLLARRHGLKTNTSGALSLAPSSSLTSPPPPSKLMDLSGQIRARDFVSCLDDVSDSEVQLWQCHPGPGSNQRWQWTEFGGLRNLLDDRCLFANASTRTVKVVPCENKPEQVWKASNTSSSRGSMAGRLRNAATGLCLQRKAPDAAQLVLGPCKPDHGSGNDCEHIWFVFASRPDADAQKPFEFLRQWQQRSILSRAQHSIPDTAEGTQGAVAPAAGRSPRHARGTRPVRLLCWVMTDPSNFESRAWAINATWGPRCDRTVYVSSQHHQGLDTVKLRLFEKESRDMLWRKAQLAWMYMYSHFLDSADWFIRLDDDSYVMVDNLREFLQGYNASEAHWLGRPMFADNVWFYSGGAGNIMSREALRVLGAAGKTDPDVFASWDTFADDLEISDTLAKLGVHVENTTDNQGRQRFFPLGINVERTLNKTQSPAHWWWSYARDHVQGPACCSDRWIVSHYTTPEEMFYFDDMHAVGCEAAGNPL